MLSFHRKDVGAVGLAVPCSVPFVLETFLRVVASSIAGTGTLSKGRAGGPKTVHILQDTYLSFIAWARVAHVGAVVLRRGTVRVEQTLLKLAASSIAWVVAAAGF